MVATETVIYTYKLTSVQRELHSSLGTDQVDSPVLPPKLKQLFIRTSLQVFNVSSIRHSAQIRSIAQFFRPN
ncbi:hypothetical protein J6590_031394 [Homalodisca vitripennis]|nr:hypothetical protein J6590_031394 [Homalodisca vitripennis]